MKIQCNCKSEFQDKHHGKNTRVATEASKVYRCTVCGKEHKK